MKEAFYFSHDCNASNDPKILAMRSVYRGSGYGWYWILIEMMRQQEDYRLSMKGKYVWNALATQLQCEPDEAHSFITDCIDEFDLFATDGEYFWSESLLRRMKIKEEKSDKARQSAMKKWGNNANASKNDANAMRTHTETNANASEIDAIKESKVNKSKVKEIGIPPDGDNNPDQIEKNKTTKTVEVSTETTENQTFVDESDSAKSDGHQLGSLLPTSDNTQDEAKVEQQTEKIILTSDEAEFMAVLETVKDYPLDRQKDLEYYHILVERYPKLDIMGALQDWKIHKLGKPLKPKENARSQINNWFQNAVKWGKNKKTSPTPLVSRETTNKFDGFSL
jgi:hypothetical protein